MQKYNTSIQENICSFQEDYKIHKNYSTSCIKQDMNPSKLPVQSNNSIFMCGV